MKIFIALSVQQEMNNGQGAPEACFPYSPEVPGNLGGKVYNTLGLR